VWQFIHDPLLNWRLTNAASPRGPNFNSEREAALTGPQGTRARRPSILNADVAPSEFLAAAQHDPVVGGFGGDGMGNGGGGMGRSRARTNSTARSGNLQQQQQQQQQHGSNAVGGETPAAMGISAAGMAAASLANNEPADAQNARALEVLDRVAQKLTGRDFKGHTGGEGGEELDVVSQVSKLIGDATNLENLCQHYIGWCSFW
jgi:FKBP12-rapamycin complex-associated protein